MSFEDKIGQLCTRGYHPQEIRREAQDEPDDTTHQVLQ